MQSRCRLHVAEHSALVAVHLRGCFRHCTALIAATGIAAGLRGQAPQPSDIDLLVLRSASGGAATPAGWATRAVRGQQLPTSRIVDSIGMRFLRISGQGQAGWFVRALPVPLEAAAGRLLWSWRSPVSPLGADISASRTDDAALRVFVVFAREGRFQRTPRVLYYSLADGDPAPDRSDAAFGVRIAGRPALTRDWMPVSAEPFLDYHRVWGRAPPPIVAIGVMQDSDQTRRAAIGDIMSLYWRRSDETQP